LEPNSLDLEGFLSKSQSKISAPAIELANGGQAIDERTNPRFHRGKSQGPVKV
jgi:hypothetical protein